MWQAESRLVREATVPMAAFAAVTERIAVGSGVVNNWTRNVGLLAATFSTLDDLAPGPRSCSASARGGTRSRRRSASTAASRCRRCARRSRPCAGCSRWSGSPIHGEFVHLDDIEIDIVHGDRSPKHVPIYIGATGDEDDGARRRDRRRRRPQLPRRPRLQRRGDGAPRGRRRAGRPHASRTSTGRSSSSARSTTDRVARPRPRAGARHAVPRPAAAHHEGERRRPGAARGDRRGAHLAGDARSRSSGR